MPKKKLTLANAQDMINKLEEENKGLLQRVIKQQSDIDQYVTDIRSLREAAERAKTQSFNSAFQHTILMNNRRGSSNGNN